MPSGTVLNIQRYSVQDGPGIRTTVFLKGCPLCCPWCHNPESRAPAPEVSLVEDRCIACGECRSVCPFAGELDNRDGPLPRRVESCALCGECAEVCPTGARQLVGRSMSVAEVVAEVARDQMFYDESSGGVTFSGGEPLSQPEFLAEVLAACRERGWHTAVDTCGFARDEVVRKVAPLVNLFLFDLKMMDDARHRQLTGVSNGPILANLEALDRSHDALWIRVPLIPGVNDDPTNLEATAQFVARLRHVRRVSLLPYHPTAADKFRRLGMAFPLGDLQAPSPENLATAVASFRECGLEVVVGA